MQPMTMKKQKFSEVVKRIWKIAAPYWAYSKERWGSLILLAVNVFVMVFQTRVGVRMTIWNRDWLNAFQTYDAEMWKQQIVVFLLVGAASTFTGSLNSYIQSWIQIRWRRWMTARYINYWLEGSTHYRMQLTGNETDNPDQRIAEDISQFIGSTWTFSFSFVQNIISLVTYVIMLYDLSLTIPLFLGGRDWSFPGYFVVISVIWAAVETVITHLIGKPLSRLNYDQQMYAANFRFALVRVRECSEQIALLRGEDVEHGRLMRSFGDIIVNQFRLMGRNLFYGIVQGFLSYVDAMMYTFLLGPSYFYYGAISGYGVFQQIATAFLNVVTGLKWFVTNYGMLAVYVAVIDRLYAFNNNYNLTQDVTQNSKIRIEEGDEDQIVIKHPDVDLPTGKRQISANDVVIKRGEKVLVKGRTGAGKTTVFRVISGIWPFGEGEIVLPKDKKVMILPQKPYFPIGTLADAITYPEPSGTYSREQMVRVLQLVGMPELAMRLDEYGHWNMMMSGGEQQRLGIARALLFNPEYLFFDEATASMDEPSELELYTMLSEEMKGSAIISIGHRSSLAQFHDRTLFAEKEPDGHYLFRENYHPDDEDEDEPTPAR
ncbi:MAG: ABC transporter ATP-binding protein/permease [Oscillospiraceae bacterium]|nr:ABC transporter ATP-binding protein/permease [Oscillospiraceae bacterium]